MLKRSIEKKDFCARELGSEASGRNRAAGEIPTEFSTSQQLPTPRFLCLSPLEIPTVADLNVIGFAFMSSRKAASADASGSTRITASAQSATVELKAMNPAGMQAKVSRRPGSSGGEDAQAQSRTNLEKHMFPAYNTLQTAAAMIPGRFVVAPGGLPECWRTMCANGSAKDGTASA